MTELRDTPPCRVIEVTREQMLAVDDAWFLASYPGCRKVSGEWVERFNAAVERITGIDVRGGDFTLEEIP